jgi:hypothetical protein
MLEEIQNRQATAGGTLRVGVLALSRIRIEHLWLLLPVFLITYKGFIFPLPPLDFWWHLKMGEVIATTRSIPRVDVFSFTATGRPFVLQNWLGELIYYWTYRVGGFSLLVFLGTAITVAGFLLMYQLCLNGTRNRRIVALIGFLAALGNYGFLRPQTYSFLLFAGFYFVLAQYTEHRRDRLWLLPFLMALWVNLHGAFVLGLGLVAIYLAAESCRHFTDPGRTDALSVAELRKLAVILLLCGTTTLLNPEGYGIYSYVRSVIFDAGSQQLVAEWQPPRLNDFLGFLLFYCPFLLAVFTFIHARVKPNLTEIVLFFGFAIFGLTAIRNAAWFSTITYPLIARYLPLVDLDPLLPLRRYKVIERLFEASASGNEKKIYGWVNCVLLILAIIVLASQSPWIRPELTGKSLLAEQTPVGVADFIQQRELKGRIFHSQEFGDYLMWRLWPEQKTFVDGRVHLFTLDFLQEYERSIQNPLSADVFERWNIQYLLLSKLSDPASLPTITSLEESGAWTKLYEDNVSVLFEKTPVHRVGRF